MANKFNWKIKTGRGGVALLRCDADGDIVSNIPIPPENAHQMQKDLNELETYRALGTPEEIAAMKEERRWRKIGEKMPEDGQECQLADDIEIYIPIYQYKARKGFYICCGDASLEPAGGIATHWRPAPTDVPKEEG